MDEQDGEQPVVSSSTLLRCGKVNFLNLKTTYNKEPCRFLRKEVIVIELCTRKTVLSEAISGGRDGRRDSEELEN